MWKNFVWLICGLVTLIVLLLPEIVLYGFMLLVIPGIILAAFPTIFMYALLITILSKLMSSYKIRYPKTLSVVIILSLGSVIPFFFNLETFSKVKELQERDIAIKDPIQIIDTIAIFADEYRYGVQGPNDPLCNALCQRLLYNKAAKNVLVGGDYSHANEKDPHRQMVSYSIEHGTKCEKVGYVTGRDDFSLQNVTLRMANGECLKKEFINLSQADFIFIKHQVKVRGSNAKWDLKPRSSLGADTVSAEGIEVLKKENSQYEPIFRYTKIQAYPLIIPLAIGPTNISLSSKMRTGLMRYSESVNVTVNYYDLLEDYEWQMKEIFGDAIADPSPGESPSYIFEKKLQDSTTSRDEIYKLFDIFIGQYGARHSTKKLSQDDANLFIRSLGDARIGYFGYTS